MFSPVGADASCRLRLGRHHVSCACERWRAAELVLAAMLCLGLAVPASALRHMALRHTWGTVDFLYESPAQRRDLIRRGTFQPGNVIPFDVDVDSLSGRVLLAMPAMLPGSPVTLAVVAQRTVVEPRLAPYPDWSWHAGARGCDGLTSVFRIFADRCGRLWVVDSGRTEVATPRPRQRCPPQLLVFDLANDRLLRRHRFPSPGADWLLLTVVVEQRGSRCDDDAFAYVADVAAFQLLVYSYREDRSWRVRSNLFYPDVNRRVFHVFGETFQLMDGVLGLSLSPRLAGSDDRYLFFHAFSSVQEGSVRTSVLRNASLFQDGGDTASDAFRFIGVRQMQAAAETVSFDGIQFFSEIGGSSISCWNSRLPYASRWIADVDTDALLIRFVTGIKVVPTPTGEELWAVANNAQYLFTGNFRANMSGSINVLSGRKEALVARTVCSLKVPRLKVPFQTNED